MRQSTRDKRSWSFDFAGYASLVPTAIKDKRVNIRLFSADLLDSRAKAPAEVMPYQTLIASVLHKYVSGKLSGQKPAAAIDSRRRHAGGAG